MATGRVANEPRADPCRQQDTPSVARAGAVDRRPLIATLEAGGDRRLVLVSAPAGFGKSTLLASWLAKAGRPFAWLSLDWMDYDITRFMRYLLAATECVGPGLGGPSVTAEPAVYTLVNALAARGEYAVLVLDDYHVIESKAVHQTVNALLELLPARAQLVIATRADAPLPFVEAAHTRTAAGDPRRRSAFQSG